MDAALQLLEDFLEDIVALAIAPDFAFVVPTCFVELFPTLGPAD
jgi:hypothetical protein